VEAVEPNCLLNQIVSFNRFLFPWSLKGSLSLPECKAWNANTQRSSLMVNWRFLSQCASRWKLWPEATYGFNGTHQTSSWKYKRDLRRKEV